jgi:hypothetical protein
MLLAGGLSAIGGAFWLSVAAVRDDLTLTPLARHPVGRG